LEIRPGIESPAREDVASNPTLSGTLTLYGGEEVNVYPAL